MSSVPVVNLMEEPRVVCRPRNRAAARNLSIAEFAEYSPRELGAPEQTPPRRGARAFQGRWWFASTREHVSFGSLAERDVLMVIDFVGEVVEIQRDPMVLLPPRGDTATIPPPWLYLGKRDGARVLVVRGRAEHAELWARLFASTSVSVASVELPAPSEMRVIKWLAGYRFTRFRAPQSAEWEAIDMCAVERPLADVAASLARRLGDPAAARAAVYAMLWHRVLTLTAIQSPVSNVSLVVAP